MGAPRDTAAPAALPPGVAVASGHELATDAGLVILRQGGHAFDAAVAVSSTLSVVDPITSGLGGGGFFLLPAAQYGEDGFVDACESARAAATPAVYLPDIRNAVWRGRGCQDVYILVGPRSFK